MKIVKEYNMNVDEDRDTFKLEQRAHGMHLALWEIQQLLRTKDKHGDSDMISIGDLRDEINQLIHDHVLEESLDV